MNSPSQDGGPPCKKEKKDNIAGDGKKTDDNKAEDVKKPDDIKKSEESKASPSSSEAKEKEPDNRSWKLSHDPFSKCFQKRRLLVNGYPIHYTVYVPNPPTTDDEEAESSSDDDSSSSS